jgi:hypothetical protein
MPNSDSSAEGLSKPPRGDGLLWLQFLGTPVLWLLFMQTAYSLQPFVCETQNRLPLYVAALIALVLSLANAAWACRHSRVLRRNPEQNETLKRAFLMARCGFWLSLLFSLLIAAQGLATIFMDPCTP